MNKMSSLESSIMMNGDEENHITFEEYVSVFCEKLKCPYYIMVKRKLIQDHSIKIHTVPTVKKKRPIDVISKTSTISSKEEVQQELSEPINSENTVVMFALYDNVDRLLELNLSKIQLIPRTLMQVLYLLIPYCQDLKKLNFAQSGIDQYAIYKTSKILPLSNITELCLDYTKLPEGNYSILLDIPTYLQNLSLCGCDVNDEVCKMIFSNLEVAEPAEKTLLFLNLSSNHITDKGVKYISQALRTNRHLQYLNLASNRLTDEGALELFTPLMEFQLTNEEIHSKRLRILEYLKHRKHLCTGLNYEMDTKSIDGSISSRKSTKYKRKSTLTTTRTSTRLPQIYSNTVDDILLTQQETGDIDANILEPFKDPFNSAAITIKNESEFCLGNMTLCYLNLAYNELSYLSLKNLEMVLRYQGASKSMDQSGLMNVVLVGNYLPKNCPELITLNELFNQNLAKFGGRPLSSKKKSRASTKLIVTV